MNRETLGTIALIGNPNCGKTALFNALTGTHQKVANYPGVTVERKEGRVVLSDTQEIRVLDLPGTYSLVPTTPDEQISVNVLEGKLGRPDLVLAVADAANLERHLALIFEIQEKGIPVVLALNMMDLAQKRGLLLDLKKLEQLLGVPVVPTVATRFQGVADLIQLFGQRLVKHLGDEVTEQVHLQKASSIEERFKRVDQLMKQVVIAPAKRSMMTEKIDRIVLHPFWGTLILMGSLFLIFQSIFNWASPLQDFVELGVSALSSQIGDLLGGQVLLKDLVQNGIIAGVGAVIVFLPQILLLFFFILILEDTGYMARAAFLMDKLMGFAGLHGKAFIPLLSSFACAIPGIMATRTIDNKKDRLLTQLIAPLMTCSARLPVYGLLIGAFVPNLILGWGIGLQGVVMFGLYLLGVVVAWGMGVIFRRTILKGEKPAFVLELPTYKVPSARNVILGLLSRAKIFLKRAGTIILALSILLWFLASFPRNQLGEAPPIQESYAGMIGKTIEPILKPIGFDWKISIALIPAFAAREVMVSALSTVYSIEQNQGESDSKLSQTLSQSWSLATALSLLAWFVFAPQCLATLAVMKRESQSWGWTFWMVTYLLGLAYGAAFLVFQMMRLVGFG